MATPYTGFVTVVGLLALLLQVPAPALWIIAGLWLWFAKGFWFCREDMGFSVSNRSGGRFGDYTPDERQVRLRRIWR
jgi:hypothetical protein